MSSSAPQRQLAPEASVLEFDYAEAEGQSGAVGAASDGGPGAQERNRRQQAGPSSRDAKACNHRCAPNSTPPSPKIAGR